jgi:hypothetical protein
MLKIYTEHVNTRLFSCLHVCINMPHNSIKKLGLIFFRPAAKEKTNNGDNIENEVYRST